MQEKKKLFAASISVGELSKNKIQAEDEIKRELKKREGKKSKLNQKHYQSRYLMPLYCVSFAIHYSVASLLLCF